MNDSKDRVDLAVGLGALAFFAYMFITGDMWRLIVMASEAYHRMG